MAAQVFAGLFFLAHPAQTESVVWIAERTNVLGLFFTLLAWYAWIARRHGKFHAAFVLALLTREYALALPLLLFLTDTLRSAPAPGSDEKRQRHYALIVIETLVYLAARSAVLGQVKIAPFWGGSLGTNIANVFSFWLEYPRALFWPFPLTLTYSWLPVADGWAHGRVLTGLASMMLVWAVVAWAWRSFRNAAFCLAAFAILWLPASNVIPLTTPFGERLMYPLMAPAAWLLALGLGRWSRRTYALTGGLVLALSLATFRRLPDWRDDVTLWTTTAKPRRKVGLRGPTSAKFKRTRRSRAAATPPRPKPR